MIAVFDNFIQDDQLLQEINNNYDTIFRDPGVYKYYDGWWNTSPKNTTQRIIEYAWGYGCPINQSFNIDGFEYWTGLQSAADVEDGWADDLKQHYG